MPSTIIIGAGMAGLTAARALVQHGWQVTVLDKGRGVGGRLATRRIENSRADHGAQYFSARTPAFQEQVQHLIDGGVVRQWNLPKNNLADSSFTHPRYIGSEGMNAIAKHLAQSIRVKTSERAIIIKAIPGGCRVTTESGNQFEADSLLITVPAPQALALVQDSDLPIGSDAHQVLAAIAYEPCIAVMALLSQPSRIPAPGMIRFNEDAGFPVGVVTDNQQKGISPNQPSVTIHASHWFSRANLEGDINALGKPLIDSLAEWLPAAAVVSYQVHRWRYSHWHLLP